MDRSPDATSLLHHFAALKDPRQHAKVVYPLPEILLLVLCATIVGSQILLVGLIAAIAFGTLRMIGH